MGRLRGTELVGMVAGALLVAALFVPWYGTDASNPHSEVHGRTGSISGWDVHPILRWLLLAAASAPFVLAWIILRGHALSWSRGEMTVVTSVRVRPRRLQRLRRPSRRDRGIAATGPVRRARRDGDDGERRREALVGVRAPAQAARNDLGETA